jgi:hypothetical protein
MAEAILAQRAGSEFRVERHRARGFEQGKIPLPDFGCKRHDVPQKNDGQP